MRIKIIVTALALSLALPAAAGFRTIQAAYELPLDNVRLPQLAGGTIAYKTCGECPFVTKRLSSDVSWHINGQPTTLVKFAAQVAELTRPDEILTVLHHLEKDQVTRVSVWVR